MYGLIHKHKAIAVIIIGIASLAFLLWMFSAADIKEMAGGSKACIVNVGDECVTLREYRIELLRTPIPENTPEIRKQIAEILAIRELLFQKAKRIGLHTSDKEVLEIIQNDPSFQENGNFNPERYKNMLINLNIMPEEYEEYLRKILTVNKLIDLIGNGIYITEEEENMEIKLQSTRIDGKAYRIDKDTVSLDYKPTEEEIKEFYENNKEMFYEDARVVVKLWKTEDKNKASDIYLSVKAGKEPQWFEVLEGNEINKLPKRIRDRLDKKDYKFDLKKIGNTFYIVKVSREEKGKIKPLREVRERIIKEILQDKADKFMKEKAEETINNLKAGKFVNIPAITLKDTPLNQLRFFLNADDKTLAKIAKTEEKIFGPFKSGKAYFILEIDKRDLKKLSTEEIEKLKQNLFAIKRSTMVDLLIKSLRGKTDIEFNMEILR